MIQDDENSNPKQHSQVATSSRKRSYLAMAIVIGLVSAILLIKTFSGKSDAKKTPDHTRLAPSYENVENVGAGMPLNRAPAIDKNQLLEEQRRKQLEMLKAKILFEKMAQQQKLYQARQNAPIEMYGESRMSSLASNNVNLGESEARPNIPMANQNLAKLPLTSSQIDKLKGMSGDSDPNSAFQDRASNTSVVTVQASEIQHRSYVVTQGTLIAGSLQTAINSDLPGMVKANVSQDVYGNDGSRMLIPKGSTLVGQYSSGVSMGQQRVFVVWTRLIRPDGVDVMLGSPGTDALGVAGLGADKLDTHFWSRFGQATLLSILSAGIANAGIDEGSSYNSASEYRQAVSESFNESSRAALYATINIKPTVHVFQGAKINVFVNRDLSFYEVLGGNV